MKVGLIFSPFSSFSYVPLGIAYLKGYIEKNAPSITVKNLDLSNDLYDRLERQEFSACLKNFCRICPEKANLKCRGILRNKKLFSFVKAARFSRASITTPNSDEFQNFNTYNRLRKVYDIFYCEIFSCITKVLKLYLELIREEDGKVLEDYLLKDDINKVVSEKPDVIGFSIFSKQQLYYSLALAKILKTRINPVIVFGGAYISHLDKVNILKVFDFIDFVICKEGEMGALELLKNIRKNKFTGVPNLVYRKGAKIVENKESVIRELDMIPFPDFTDFRLDSYFNPEPVVSTLFSRGCFWGACNFCAHHKSYSVPYRTRSVSNFISELRQYQKRGIRYLSIADEVISASDLRLISKAIIRENVKMYFCVMVRPTPNFTHEILKVMYEAGFRNIRWGVESFSQRILDLMNKGVDSSLTEGILRTSHKAGLSNTVYMIMGFPTQTVEEYLKDADILRKNSEYIYTLGWHNFWLEEDTAIFRDPEKFGLKRLNRDVLLNTKKGKLFASTISFANKDTVDWGRLNELFKKDQDRYKFLNKFKDTGLFFCAEHRLLHLAGR